jgi:hypothetical protein
MRAGTLGQGTGMVREYCLPLGSAFHWNMPLSLLAGLQVSSGTARRLRVAIAVRVYLQRTGDRVIVATVSIEEKTGGRLLLRVA